jgi:hypothetical protein
MEDASIEVFAAVLLRIPLLLDMTLCQWAVGFPVFQGNVMHSSSSVKMSKKKEYILN